MAEDKNAFLFYVNWGDTFDELSNEDAGKLIKHLCDYVRDENPESDSVLIKAVFANMKSTLKRDLKKWDDEKKVKSLKAKMGNLKRWHPDLYDQVVKDKITPEQAFIIVDDRGRSEPIPKVAVNDTVSDSVNDTVSEKKKKPKNKFSGFNKIKESFESFYNHKTQGEYYWTAKDSGKVNPIISKLRFKIKEKSGLKNDSDISDEDLVKSFEVLLTIIKDEWILSNLTMAIIDSKFNEIMANRNGRKTKSATGYDAFTSTKVPNNGG